MTKRMRRLPGMAVVMAVLMAAAPPSVSWAAEFSEANVFAELNNTDGDLGFHSLIDGDAWKQVEIQDPNGRTILLVRPVRSLGQQGLTELFFESAEPTFDELSPEEFFDRFPEGEHKFFGRTIDGEKLEASAEFTHVMPAPPVIEVNKNPVPEDCNGANPGSQRAFQDPLGPCYRVAPGDWAAGRNDRCCTIRARRGARGACAEVQHRAPARRDEGEASEGIRRVLVTSSRSRCW